MSKTLKEKYKKGDSFSREARLKGFRSRSALKLLEIQKKDKILKKGIQVLDIGSSPGGWSQVCVSFGSKVVAIDIKEMKTIEGVQFIKKNLESTTDMDFLKVINNSQFDIVLSDLAPNISGITYRDESIMIKLLKKVFLLMEACLKEKGVTLLKAFQGESLEFSRNYMKSRFERVKIRKPKSSRSNSREVYLLGKNYKRNE